MTFHYNHKQFVETLEKVGLKRGDIVFTHSNVGFFGIPEGGLSNENIFHTILNAFIEVIGNEGTLVVPTFTYSFCQNVPFDLENTPSVCGMFTEKIRLHPESVRSSDPIFSVAALGKSARELTENVSQECFGKDSFWDRFFLSNGKVCNLNFDAGSTFIHYVEKCLQVPYRYDKLFPGILVEKGYSRKTAAIYFCLDLMNPDTIAEFEVFDKVARKKGLAKTERVGRGAIVYIKATDVYNLISSELKNSPWFLTGAVKTGKSPILITSRKDRFKISLPKNAPMKEIIEAVWSIPRDLLSDAYDAVIDVLAEQGPMTIHEYPTGTRCFDLIVPERWTCHEAYLETINGKRLFSYADHPLHVVSYSLPYEGFVSREKLFEHLHVHPKVPDAIPFVSQYLERNWGLCCSKNFKENLTDDQYHVLIKTDFSYSTLKVAEAVIPGKSDECIILCSHLSHPRMVNDDLTGVVIGLEVIRKLFSKPKLQYTIRFLIFQGRIGAAAYLSHNKKLVQNIKGGIFLRMLGLQNPHALQQSFYGDAELDRSLGKCMEEYDPHSWTGAFGTIFEKDKELFNTPSGHIPMLFLSRALPQTNPEAPYREYLSSYDTPELLSYQSLEGSLNLVLRMIEACNSGTLLNITRGKRLKEE